MTWTAERIDILKKRWAAGYSGEAIASELGTSRNSVIGKANRLGLRKKSEDVPVAPKPERTEPFKRSRYAASLAPESFHAAPVPAPDPDAPYRWDGQPLPESKPAFLLDLTGDQCRWPLDQIGGRQRFCGARQSEGCPYCKAHWKRSLPKAA